MSYINTLTLAAVSGLAALSLLAVGIGDGVAGSAYMLTFYIHLVLHVSLVLVAAYQLCLILRADKLKLYLVVIFLLLTAGQALLPVTARDALIHHLAVPKFWLEEGAITALRWHSWAHYPMLLPLVYVGFLKLGVEALAALYHFSFFILSIWAATLLSNDAKVKPTIALLVCSVPIFLKLAATPLVDMALVFYSLIGLATILEGQFILSAVMFALAWGIKPNGLVSLGVACIVSLLNTAQPIRVRLRGAVIVPVVTIIFFSPWLLKNGYFTGNPFYPMFESSQYVSSMPPSQSFSPLEVRHYMYGESLFEILLLPFRLFLFGQDNNPAAFDGISNPWLLLSLPAIFLFAKSPRSGVIAIFGWFYILLAVTLRGARVRYVAPAVAALAVPAATIIAALMPKIRLPNWLITFVIAAPALIYIPGWLQKTDLLFVIRERPSKDAYLVRNVSEYGMISHVNDLANDGRVVYPLYTANYYYYYKVPVFSGGYAAERPLVSWVHTSGSVEFLKSELANRNIGYFVAHKERVVKGLTNVLSPVDLEIWKEFANNNLQVLYEDQEYILWRIVV